MIRGMRKTIWVLDDTKATLLIEAGAGVSEVAKTLNVSRQTVYAAIRKGRIPAPNARLGSSSIAQQDSTTANAACAGETPPRG